MPLLALLLSVLYSFPVHGHDELFRRDCRGRDLIWCGGNWNFPDGGGIDPAYEGVRDGTVEGGWLGKNPPPPTLPIPNPQPTAPIRETEYRWPACGGNDQEGWAIDLDGVVDRGSPLAPYLPGADDEWQSNPGVDECANAWHSRLDLGDRWVTPSPGTPPVHAALRCLSTPERTR